MTHAADTLEKEGKIEGQVVSLSAKKNRLFLLSGQKDFFHKSRDPMTLVQCGCRRGKLF